MQAAIVVGSGPSARGFRPPDGIPVYGVNGTSTWLPRLDVWFTLDERALRYARTPRKGTRYIAALPKSFSIPKHVVRYERLASGKTSASGYGLDRWQGICGINKTPGKINTGNSAWGALQVAYQDGARRILLVGVDANYGVKVEGGVPGDLSHLPELFSSALTDVSLVSCGAMVWRGTSCSREEGIQWLLK